MASVAIEILVPEASTDRRVRKGLSSWPFHSQDDKGENGSYFETLRRIDSSAVKFATEPSVVSMILTGNGSFWSIL